MVKSSLGDFSFMWKKAVLGILMLLILSCIGFSGCGADTEDKEKIEDLAFTVVGEADVPQTLKDMIIEKKEKPFKLTYADGQDMYIVIGTGPQASGGYSIAVKELYRTENSIVYKTELLGPDKKEAEGTEPSYPVLVIKTGFREEPVVFK